MGVGLVQSILLVIGTMLTLILYRRLISWWIQFKKWEQQPKERKQDDKTSLIGQTAPELEAVSIDDNKVFNIQHIKQDTVLVFLDSECAHCSNHFEFFLDQIHHKPNIHFVAIMHKSRKDDAYQYRELFGKKIDFYLVEDETFINYQLRFWPAFVYIDKSLKIINITPIPSLLFSHQQKMLIS